MLSTLLAPAAEGNVAADNGLAAAVVGADSVGASVCLVALGGG